MREEILRILKSLLGDQVNFAVTLQNLHTPPPPLPPHGDEIWLEF